MTLWMFFQQSLEDQTAKADNAIAALEKQLSSGNLDDYSKKQIRQALQTLEQFKLDQTLPAFYKKIEGVILFGEFVVTSNAGFNMPDWWVKGCSRSIAKNELIGMTYRKIDCPPVYLHKICP